MGGWLQALLQQESNGFTPSKSTLPGLKLTTITTPGVYPLLEVNTLGNAPQFQVTDGVLVHVHGSGRVNNDPLVVIETLNDSYVSMYLINQAIGLNGFTRFRFFQSLSTFEVDVTTDLLTAFHRGILNIGDGQTVNLFQVSDGAFTGALTLLQAGGLTLKTGATPIGAIGTLGFGTTSGFGNGAAGTAVTTTLLGTGTGPATPQTVVDYLKISLGGTFFWIPLMQ